MVRKVIGQMQNASMGGRIDYTTGFGGRGWSIRLGSGKLLTSHILGLSYDIDPEPYLPTRFNFNWKRSLTK